MGDLSHRIFTVYVHAVCPDHDKPTRMVKRTDDPQGTIYKCPTCGKTIELVTRTSEIQSGG